MASTMDGIGETFIDSNENMDHVYWYDNSDSIENILHALGIIRLMRMMSAVNILCSHQRMME